MDGKKRLSGAAYRKKAKLKAFNEFENFKVNTYFMILDQIKSDLENRKIAYDNLTSKYNFFYHLSELTPSEVKKSSESLQIYTKTI